MVFPGQRLDKDLHTPAKAEDEMKCRLLLNIIVGKSAPVFELLAGEDQPLLVRGDTLLVLYLRLHVIDGIGRLDFEGDGLARQSLDKNLHATAETQDEMESALLLDIVIVESATILQLFTSKDEALLVRRDAFLVLNLGFDIIDGIRRFHLKGDGLSGEGLDKDLHDWLRSRWSFR